MSLGLRTTNEIFDQSKMGGKRHSKMDQRNSIKSEFQKGHHGGVIDIKDGGGYGTGEDESPMYSSLER